MYTAETKVTEISVKGVRVPPTPIRMGIAIRLDPVVVLYVYLTAAETRRICNRASTTFSPERLQQAFTTPSGVPKA